jgi:glycosyltransferase involved in cell wall biosynthesis
VTPRVSVVVPTYGRLAFLPRALDSILAQTFDDLEVVVVDDGSPDGTAAFVAGHTDPRVRLVRHERNRGLAAARNTGVRAARAPFVAFLDDDDLWLPEKLERQVPLLEAGAAVVHTLVWVADGDGNVLERPSERGFRLFREVAAAGYPYHWLLRRSSFQINSFAVARTALDDAGGFDERLGALADLDLVHRLRRRHELVLVDEPLVKYCHHGGNTAGTSLAREWPVLAEKELAYLRSADLPHRREIEAYLHAQLAQSAYILGDYRRAATEAVRARRLDPTVLPGRAAAKYAAGAVLSPLANAARSRRRQARGAGEPDPWLDLPTAT